MIKLPQTTLLLVLFLSVSSLYGQLVPKFEWALRLGNYLPDEGKAIGVDDAGNVYTAGLFRDTADFDPGVGVYNLISLGGSAIYISKLDPSGNFVWAKMFSSPNGLLDVDMVVDRQGNVYTTGLFFNVVDFDPGIGIYNLTSPPLNNNDIFISKLDNSGNFVWAKHIGGSGLDYSDAITVDIFGNVYFTGRFDNTVDFDPGAGTFNLTNMGNGTDAFICKLNNSGVFIWSKQFEGNEYEFPESITVDSVGNVFTTGTFWGNVDFDPGIGVFILPNGFDKDIYISKLNSAGDFLWAKKFDGGSYDDYSWDIDLDSYGNVYTTGSFRDTVDFDPGAGTFNLSSPSNYDVFISKLDSLGNFIWAKQIGGASSSNDAFSIAIDAQDNVYTTGYFSGTTDFDPGIDTYIITNSGSSDIFISKLDSSGKFLFTSQLKGDGNDFAYSMELDTFGNIYTTGKSNSFVSDFDPGFGIYNLNMIGSNDIYVNKLSQCFSSSDSIVVSACNNFISPSGYYNWTSSGIYSDVILNSEGCDSIITINLTMDTIDLNVTSVSFTLISNETGASSYQWVDCSTMLPLPGDTNALLIPSSNGSYAVIITKNGCVDTSSCYLVSGIGIREWDLEAMVKIYPNPVEDILIIETNLVLIESRIYDITGRLVKTILDGKKIIDISELNSGYYHINLNTPKGVVSKKVFRN